MLYILETEISNNKILKSSLKNVYGLGENVIKLLFKQLGFSINVKLKQLTPAQIKILLKCVDNSNLSIGTKLKNKKTFLFKRLVDLKTYKGLRKLNGLPVRGQRTRTNGKTARRFKKY